MLKWVAISSYPFLSTTQVSAHVSYTPLALDLHMVIHSIAIGYACIFSVAKYTVAILYKVNKQDLYKNWNLKKEVGIAIKSKQTSNQLETVTFRKYLYTILYYTGYCYNSKAKYMYK